LRPAQVGLAVLLYTNRYAAGENYMS
jgi:hypothetical protein